MSAGAIIGLCAVGFAVSLIVCVVIGAMASVAGGEPGGDMSEQGHRAVAWVCSIGLASMLTALAAGVL